MRFHPLCELFPILPDDELAALAEDLKKHGQREPILIYDGKIIDGRNRFLACKLAGVEPEFRKFDGSNPRALVASLNLHRRHLNESQRAMLAAALVKGAGPIGPAVSEAAKLTNTSARSVKRALRVNRLGSEKLKKAVRKGTVSVSRAATVSGLPKPKQMRALKQARPPEEKPGPSVKDLVFTALEEVKTNLLSPYSNFETRTVKEFYKQLLEKFQDIL